MIKGTFYTLSETAQLLGKNRRTIWMWLKEGKILGERVGNMVLIAEGEVKRLQCQNPEPTFSTETPSVPEVGTFSTKSERDRT